LVGRGPESYPADGPHSAAVAEKAARLHRPSPVGIATPYVPIPKEETPVAHVLEYFDGKDPVEPAEWPELLHVGGDHFQLVETTLCRSPSDELTL